MKNNLGGETLHEFVALIPTTHSYFRGNGCVDKKAKCTKKCVIQQEIKREYYKCLKSNKTILRSQQWFRVSCTGYARKKSTRLPLVQMMIGKKQEC